MRAILKSLAVIAFVIFLFSGKIGVSTQAEDTTTSDFQVTIEQSSNGRCIPAADPVKLSWFYKPPTDMTKMLKHFDIVVLTKLDEKYMQQAKSAGKPVLQYIRWDSIHDPCGLVLKPKGSPCSCDAQPLRNNVGWLKTDLCDIRDNHSDWFLRDANGKIISIDGMVVMDPGNSGWRNFWLSRIKQSQADGWDGIFMDNMGTQFYSHGYGLKDLQKYPTTEAYQNAIISFLSGIRNDYFAPKGKPMYGNVSVHWGQGAFYLKMMQYLDGSMDEFWAVSRNNYYTIKAWEDRLVRTKEALRQGNVIMLTTQGSQTDYNRQRFALASYLLVSNDKTYFRYTTQNGGAYREIWLYDNYKAKLGKPLSDYTRSGNTWTRKFSNGKVTVNPETRSSSIQIYNTSNTCQ